MRNDYSIVQADAARLDDVGPLFKGMVEHHREVAGDLVPVRAGDEAWRRRRRQYETWLAGGRTWLLLAVPASAPDRSPDGYAVVRLSEPGPTWDLGEAVGELESLAVAGHARGRGLGTALMAAARDLLRAQGAGYWLVSVVAANADAVRLYERSGFRPYYQDLLARL